MPMPAKILFTVEKLKEMLDYSAETGEFRWKVSPAPSVRVGDIAGSRGPGGGEFIMINYRPYASGRLAWMYVHGAAPNGQIRHINGDPTDNRIANLKSRVEQDARPEDISLEQLREELHYDPADGQFYWKKPRGGPKRIDSDGVENRAGSKRGDGYVSISALGFKYLAHRLAWFYVHGVWPENIIDHINNDRTDNRIENLREASENSRNQGLRSDNTSGFRGVSFSKEHGKWVARIVHNYRQHVLGYFDVKEDAIAAYNRQADEFHGAFARLN